MYGVSDQQYARHTGIGEEVKLNGACYRLVENRSVEGGVRWWSGRCTDSRQAPLDLDPVVFDGAGRLIPDQPGPSSWSRSASSGGWRYDGEAAVQRPHTIEE